MIDGIDEQDTDSGWTFDKVAAFGSLVEGWYSLFEGLWTGTKHGDLLGINGVPFFVPLCVEWPAWKLQELLEHYGIEMYGYGACGMEQFFYIDCDDAERVATIFDNCGVPTIQPGEAVQWKG